MFRIKTHKRFCAATLALTLSLTAPLSSADLTDDAGKAPLSSNAAQQAGVLERGYRTGYSDGYQSGYGDSLKRLAPDYRTKDEYVRADRAYAASFGVLEDYSSGYRQGFETGYDAGFARRTFDSTAPASLTRRESSSSDNSLERAAGSTDDSTSVVAATGDARTGDARTGDVATGDARPTITNDSSGTSGTNETSGTSAGDDAGAARATGNGIDIPADTVLRAELLTNLSTDASLRGDRIQARVIEPSEYQGAMLSGRVIRVKRAGRARGTAELQLAFEQIRLPDNRFTNINAQVIGVDQAGGDGSVVGDVDAEGGVRGTDSTKGDAVKIGAGAALGALIGAIAGGGKGAAVGAAVGGAAGTGGAIASRGKDIRLIVGQQLTIRTLTDTRIQ